MAASPTTSPHGARPLVAALRGALGAGALAVAASVLMPSGVLAATAAATTPDPQQTDPQQTGPSLTITVDDGSTTVKEGDRRTYTTTIRNIGTTDAEKLVVTLSLPPGARVDSADRDAVVGDSVVWHTDIPRGQTSSFVASLRAGQAPPNQLRLAVVSCVTLEDADRPVVCAADSDVLPSAAAAHRDDQSDGVIGPLGLAASLATLGGVLSLGVVAALAGRRLIHRRRLVTTGEVTSSEAAPPEDPIAARELVEVPAQPSSTDDAGHRSADHGAVPHSREQRVGEARGEPGPR